MEVKYWKNVSFFEAGKIVDSYIKENTNCSMENKSNQQQQSDKYEALIQKLI